MASCAKVEPEFEVTLAEEPNLGGGTATIVHEYNLTYLGFLLISKNESGRGNGSTNRNELKP
ncbi:hypothetical protein GO009_15680 [Muricauda sp. TY007]|uniref:hypothetical protein n=1 Tax=Allomuricauda sp. TY007 TaxID=2683200 RepID=UPI0013C24BF1|nr:hypothetical protein [Muricauda sp. TY007]NDV17461.1 hypothetical protein [Muricauda sp. TY007]